MDPLNIESFLKFGTLGLCALMLVLFWRVLAKEQNREGEPRSGVLKMAFSFIGMSFVLAGVSVYVEVSKLSDADAQAQQTLIGELQDEVTSNLVSYEKCQSTLDVTEKNIELLKDLLDIAKEQAEKISGDPQVKSAILNATEYKRTLEAGKLMVPKNLLDTRTLNQLKLRRAPASSNQ